MTTRFSIVTVVRNDPRVAQAVQSVLEQKFDGSLEYIVVDGASTDGTHAALEPFKSRLNTIVSEPDRGIYDAMNKGLALTTGDVVGFLNADDRYAHAEVLARVARAFKDPDLQACFGDLAMLSQGEGANVLRCWRSSPFRPGAFNRGWMPPHPTFFARKEVYSRLGGFRPEFRIAADFELMLRFLEKHRIHSTHIPEVLIHMRAGGASNGSIGRIARANVECRRAFEANELPCSPLFIPLKLTRHAWQLFDRRVR